MCSPEGQDLVSLAKCDCGSWRCCFQPGMGKSSMVCFFFLRIQNSVSAQAGDSKNLQEDMKLFLVSSNLGVPQLSGEPKEL